MLDDLDQQYCNTKHYGPVLAEENGYLVMRCSFCEIIFKTPAPASSEDSDCRKNSKTCIQACDWFNEDQMVKCRACGYTGPIP